MQEILRTVGARLPETGAKIFSRWEHMGIETVEYDEAGSEAAGGAIYSPDTKWGLERLEHHVSQPEMRLWTGDVHSHPGNFGHPSSKSGKGLGDLGYVEEVFAQNEIMEYFFIPIFTGTGTAEVTLHPWICRRGKPVQLMIAEVRICESDEDFPNRVFNPAWELGLVAETTTETRLAVEEPPYHIETTSVARAGLTADERTAETAATKAVTKIWQPDPSDNGKTILFPHIYVPTISPGRAIQIYKEIQESKPFSRFDLETFRHLLQDAEYTSVFESTDGIQVRFEDMFGQIILPTGFPDFPPVIRFDYKNRMYEVPPNEWLVSCLKSPERRLADDCLAVACLLREQHRKG